MADLEISNIERIVLLGGGALLRKLVNWARSEGAPVSVVTSPRHAAEEIDGSSLVEFLERCEVPHAVCGKIADAGDFIGDTSDAFCLSLGAAWIFSEKVISGIFQERIFNLHGTRLPQNRGGGGFSWQILMGNRLGFCLLHQVDGGVDTGRIVRSREFLYPPACRIPADFEKVYIEANLGFVTDFIEEARRGGVSVSLRDQAEYFSTYWPRLNTGVNGWIDWSLERHQLERLICAFDDPYAGASTRLNGDVVRLKGVCLDHSDGAFHAYQSGVIYRKSGGWVCVAVTGGSLIVREILNPDGENIINGVRAGDRLLTNSDDLDASRARVAYTPEGLK